MSDLTTVEAPEVDFKRDRWDRPVIGQLDGSAPLPYTRSSSAAKAIEDTFNLERWAERMVAYGMAHDASLVARVLAEQGTPETWEKPEKGRVNEIVTAAKGVAQAHKAADIGTAVHKLTERVDRGEQVSAGPYAADLVAYTSTLDRLGIIRHKPWIECRMVNDVLRMAGTADRIVTLAPWSPLRAELGIDGDIALIDDTKTGERPPSDFSGLTYSAQLAAYATGLLYDPVADVRLPTPVMSHRWGLIVHLPAGKGECHLYKADLEKGLAAAHVANALRVLRKDSKSWLTPLTV